MDYPLSTSKSQDEPEDRLCLIGERQSWLQSSWPELLSLVAWLWGIEAGSITSILESIGLLLIMPLGIRAGWNIAILLHGTGHTLLIAAVDGKSSGLNIENITEHQNLVVLGLSLIPFHSINGPTSRSSESLWLHAGDQEAWKIRIKATGGLLMNGIALAIAIALINLATSNMEQHDQITHLLFIRIHLWSLLVSNAALLVCSRTDWSALWTGQATCFYCGNFGFIAEQEEVSENELLSRQGIERFHIMGHETEVRGEQAGGGLVLASDSSGHVRFVGHKVVNQKRKNLTYHPYRELTCLVPARQKKLKCLGRWPSDIQA